MAAPAPPLPGPQPSPYSSQSNPQVPQYQTQAQSIVPLNDPLFDSLKQYITTGQNAEHLTNSQLQQIFHNTTSRGRAGLELFLSSSYSQSMQIWHETMPMKGRITMSKILFEFSLVRTFPREETGIQYRVDGRGFWILYPWAGEVEYAHANSPVFGHIFDNS